MDVSAVILAKSIGCVKPNGQLKATPLFPTQNHLLLTYCKVAAEPVTERLARLDPPQAALATVIKALPGDAFPYAKILI